MFDDSYDPLIQTTLHVFNVLINGTSESGPKRLVQSDEIHYSNKESFKVF